MSERDKQPGRVQAETGACGLIALSVAEIRKLLWRLVWAVKPTVKFILGWSVWRRHHQARARECHYKRRLDHLEQQLQL